jgi:hypothetical protein
MVQGTSAQAQNGTKPAYFSPYYILICLVISRILAGTFEKMRFFGIRHGTVTHRPQRAR